MAKPKTKPPSGEPKHLPTPEEIAEKTASIRESWSEDEMRKRAGIERLPVEIGPVERVCFKTNKKVGYE